MNKRRKFLKGFLALPFAPLAFLKRKRPERVIGFNGQTIGFETTKHQPIELSAEEFQKYKVTIINDLSTL